MGRLLECVKDDSRMVAQKTEEALEALIHAISPPQRCLQVLIPIIISEQAPVLQASIRTLSKLVPRIPTEALLESLPSMLPGLFEVRITLTARAFCVVLLCSQQAFGRRSTTRTRTCGRPWCSAWWTSTWCSARSSKRTWASSMPRRYAAPHSFPAFPRPLRAFTVVPTRFQRALLGSKPEPRPRKPQKPEEALSPAAVGCPRTDKRAWLVSQLRLVRIYINRMNKARSERAVRPHQTL